MSPNRLTPSFEYGALRGTRYVSRIIIKYDSTQLVFPILVHSLLASMDAELGSVAQPTQGVQRSTRHGRGSNGRDVQLDRLGDILTAPTRQAKKRFAPDDGLLLPDNILAPAPKKRRKSKKVRKILFIELR